MNHFLRQLGARFGGFPKNYICADLETSGLSGEEDLILQIGYVIVEDGKPVDKIAVVLNWPDSGLVQTEWLLDRLDRTRRNIEFTRDGQPTGKRYDFTYDFLQTGSSPVGTLQAFHGLLEDLRSVNYPFVFHNGYNFDGRMLASSFRRYLGLEWGFRDNEVWDTGMIEKASQINSIPRDDDTLESFSRRVGAGRFKGVFWNLADHCVKKYELDKAYDLSREKNCDAGADAMVTHYLFEKFKSLADQNLVHPDTPPF